RPPEAGVFTRGADPKFAQRPLRMLANSGIGTLTIIPQAVAIPSSSVTNPSPGQLSRGDTAAIRRPRGPGSHDGSQRMFRRTRSVFAHRTWVEGKCTERGACVWKKKDPTGRAKKSRS